MLIYISNKEVLTDDFHLFGFSLYINTSIPKIINM